jgi:hypothetical protein
LAEPRRAESPDGRHWEVRIQRVRLPSWRHSEYESDSDDLLLGLVETIVVGPVFWFVIPLFRMLAELPVAIGRSFFSSASWVEARCQAPGQIAIVWCVSRQRAEAVADELVERLRGGYGNLTFEGAKLVSMTEPPGFRDLDS